MHEIWLLATPLVAAVYGVAAIAKLRDPGSVDRSFAALEVPRGLSRPWLRRLFPWAELALALALLLAQDGWLIAAAAASLALALAYLALVVRAASRPAPPPCGCFGVSNSRPVDGWTVARNLLLATIAAVVLGITLAAVNGTVALEPGATAGPIEETGASSAGPWIAAAARAPLTLVAGALVAGMLALLAKDGDLQPATRGSEASAAGSAAVPAERTGPRHVQDEPASPAQVHPEPIRADDAGGQPDGLDYVRRPIPLHPIRLPDGSIRSLRELAADGAVVLVGASETCSSCQPILRRRHELARLVDPARLLIVSANPEEPELPADAVGADGEGPRALWCEDLGDGVGRVLEAAGRPWTVVLGADGMLAGGPVSGEDAIVALCGELRDAFDEAGITAEVVELARERRAELNGS